MHRVPELVRQRGHVGVLAVVVQQQVRVHVVGAPVHVRTAPLSGRGIQVHPAPVESHVERLHVVRAQDGDRVLDLGARLLDGVFERHVRDEGRVEVVVVQRVDAQHPLAKLKVAMEGGQMPIHAVYQLVIHRHRDSRLVERALQGRAVASGPGQEKRLLHIGVHGRTERAIELRQRSKERFHHLAAIVSVGGGAGGGEGGHIEPHVVAVGELHRRIRQVRIEEHARAAARACGHGPGQRDQLFLRLGARMRLAAEDITQILAVRCEAGLLRHEPLHHGRIHRKNLGLQKRPRRRELGGELRHLLDEALVLRDARVLIGGQAGVNGQALEPLHLRGLRIERRGHLRGAIPERPLERTRLRYVRREPLLLGGPRRVVRVQLGQVPPIRFGNRVPRCGPARRGV